jgi:lysophospholipase L1-like esterase
LLLWTVRYFYARELAVRLEPSGVDVVTRSGNPAGTRILFLGDSRAADWPGLPGNRFLTINAGASGATTSQIVLGAATRIAAEKPEVILVQAGINDLKAIGVAPAAAAQIEGRCVRNLMDIVNLCRHRHARVVLTLIIPPGRISLARRLVWSDRIEVARRNANAALVREFSGAQDVAILDPGSILARSNAGFPGSFYRDSLHLLPSAYSLIEPELLKLVGQLLAHGSGGADSRPQP